MHNSNNKKPLGFLSIVAFLMIMVGVGYTVSSVFAVNNPKSSTQPIVLPESQPQAKEPLFSSLEKQVADKATSLRNELLGTTTENENQPSFSNDLSDEKEKTELPSNAVAVITLAVPHPLPKVYGDIHQSAYADAILILYSHGLLQEGKNFYPDNYVKISDFIRVVMDAYRLQL
jgi:hypothetical protein